MIADNMFRGSVLHEMKGRRLCTSLCIATSNGRVTRPFPISLPQCDAADHGEMRSVQNKLSRPSSVATEMLFGILSHGDIAHSLRGAALRPWGSNCHIMHMHTLLRCRERLINRLTSESLARPSQAIQCKLNVYTLSVMHSPSDIITCG